MFALSGFLTGIITHVIVSCFNGKIVVSDMALQDEKFIVVLNLDFIGSR